MLSYTENSIRKKWAKNSLDLTGVRYGRLVGKYRLKNDSYKDKNGKTKYKAVWLFQCDCGNQVAKRANTVTSNNTSSCGCRRRDALIEYNYKNKRLGFGVASRNHLLLRYKKDAAARNISWKLSEKEFIALTSSNCHYCGIAPFQINKVSVFGSYTYNGIDRKDNLKPYESTNCVPCCGPCNLMKMDLTDTDFISICEKIYKKSIGDDSYEKITDNRKRAKERNNCKRNRNK